MDLSIFPVSEGEKSEDEGTYKSQINANVIHLFLSPFPTINTSQDSFSVWNLFVSENVFFFEICKDEY